MGTSSSYKSSIKNRPEWGKLSGSMKRNCSGENVPDKGMKNIMSNYSAAVRSANQSRGGGRNIGRSAIKAAQGLAGFFNSVSGAGEGRGLEDVLNEYGLQDLSNKTVTEVVNFLLEHINGPSSTKDDTAAKEASKKILEDFVDQAKTVDELENNLKEKLDEDTLEEILLNYYVHYIHEDLSRMFYEELVKEKGKKNCNGLFKDIKNYIRSRLTRLNNDGKLSRINFNSSKWKSLVKDMYDKVIKVFGDE